MMDSKNNSSPKIDGKQQLVAGHDERTRFEKALELSAAWSRTILESARDAIIVIDSEGTILTFNRAAEEIFAYRRQEVLGKISVC